MIPEVIRLQFYSATYSRKDKYKADILLRKNQVDTKEDNKDIQLLKEELWTRRTTVEVTMLKRNKTIDNLDILEEIKKNNTREHKVDQVLKRGDRLT